MIEISGTDFDDDTPGYDVFRLGEIWSTAGSADAAAWSVAPSIEWGREPFRTRFRACWDDRALHIRFDAADESPWHTMTRRDDHLWEEEVVEIFVDADGSGRNYAELEISPANVVCDLRVATPWPDLKSATAWDWEHLSSSVVPMAGDGSTRGWTAIARLPWAGLRSLYAAEAVALPPSPGTRWRFNVFRIKRPNGPARPNDGAVYAAWSRPEGPSFHDPRAFRPLVFR